MLFPSRNSLKLSSVRKNVIKKNDNDNNRQRKKHHCPFLRVEDKDFTLLRAPYIRYIKSIGWSNRAISWDPSLYHDNDAYYLLEYA